MSYSDPREPDSRARPLASPFDSAMTDFRALLSAHVVSVEADTHISALIQQLARVAKAQGLKAEALVVAVRNAWEREVMHENGHSTFRLPDGAEVERHRVIGALLDAYFPDR